MASKGNLATPQKKADYVAKQEAACRKREETTKQKAEEKFQLVTDPVKLEEKREKVLNLGCK